MSAYTAGVHSDPRNVPATDPIADLPLRRRVQILSGADTWHTEAVPELSIRAAFLADGPHGMRVEDEGGLGGRSRPATCFPTAAALGNSWDDGLVQSIGEAIGAEARAEGVDVVLGPGLNIKRHPHCGRNFEYFSEDPLLTGGLAAAMVRGIQQQGVGACVKHFAVNNQESNRLVVDAVVDERTLREIYLAGFEAAVAEQPWAVMAAYNRVNGEYACEHEYLLGQILRDEWGFQGLVVSDWGATNNRPAAIRAGLDLEMPGTHGLNDAEVLAAVRSGELPEADVDACASRVVSLSRRSTRPRPEEGVPTAGLHDEHHLLARRAAAHSTVLLTNNGLLPLTGQSSVAVIGAFAEHPRYQGAGSSQVNPTRVDAFLPAIREHLAGAADVVYAPGYDPIGTERDDRLIAEAVSVARSAEVAVVLVGLPARAESEGFDRSHMRLPQQHDRLVEAVCEANPSTIVALSHGAPVQMPWAQRPAAILDCYLSGQAGGGALVDVLFGVEDPAGRLAESVPMHHVDVPSDPWFPGQPTQVEYREGLFVGYRYYDTVGAGMRFPFGHGLSYTTFEYSDLVLDGMEGSVRVQVRNVGARRGVEVVQVYVHRDQSQVVRPEQELRGFAKISLDPGESTEVQIGLPTRAFAHFDASARRWVVEPGTAVVRVGASSRDIRLRGTLVVGEPSSAIEAQAHRAEAQAHPGDAGAHRPEGDPRAVSDDQFAALLGHPIPVPTPQRPFTRNSAMQDLNATWLGRGVLWGVKRAARPAIEHMAGEDPVMQDMMWRSLSEAPIRWVAQLSQGRVTWPMVDLVLDVLNGDPVTVVRRATRNVRSRLPGSPV